MIITGTTVTVILSYIKGVQVQTYKPSLQPKNAAFSIWGIIFASLTVSGFVLSTSKIEQSIPSVLCLSSLLACSLWLYVANTKYSVYILLVASLFACSSSVIFEHSNNLESSLILLGPNLLCSWLTIASALSLIIHLKEFWNISEQKWMVVPFFVLNIGISGTNTILGSYFGSMYITFPLLWTAYFSNDSNAFLFLVPVVFQVGFLIGKIAYCV